MRRVHSRHGWHHTTAIIVASLAVIALVVYSVWFWFPGNSDSNAQTALYEQDTQIPDDEKERSTDTGSAVSSDDGAKEVSVPDDNTISGGTSDDDSVSEESPDGSASGTQKSLISSDAVVSSIDGGVITRKTSPLDVQEAATELLVEYRDHCDCVPYQSGYLDLQGQVWSCVIVGDRWVDTCFVEANEDATGSELMVIRMDVNAWERDIDKTFGGQK